MTLPNEEPQNPYAAPTVDLGSVFTQYGTDDIDQQHAETIRRTHLNHEASVRSIGLLYLLGGIFGVFSLISSVFAMLSQLGDRDVATTGPIVVLVILFAMTATQIVLGLGIRQLRGWARIAAIIFTVLGLLYFVIVSLFVLLPGRAGPVEVIILTMMTAVPAYVLWLLIGKKGRMIFSPEYQVIREMTPEIKYRTSIIVKVCVGLLIALILIGLVVVFVGLAVA